MKLKDLPTKYNFKTVEKGRYQKWIDGGYFAAGDISKTPYTIMMPPPNITGKLHLGHVLDNTMQDIIIRRKRMMGFDALFLPGMDHASIATQTKIEEKLKSQGMSRYDLGREKFLELAWKWKEEHAKIIRDQWAVLGVSVDYNRERFTLDKGLSDAVNQVFVKMYNDGLIYRGERIINWDVQSKTAISNIEVEYEDVEGAFYHFIYPFVDGDGGLEIVTTRPETMFADQALMVHPKDSRYKKYIGRKVYIPGTGIQIPVITDSYVDREFGTGVVKVTPAHDPNDFEVGTRHNLERPLCMEEDGIMNELAGKYQGMDRFECRKAVVEELTKIGLCPRIEKMIHSVGHSERTGVIVEPRLSKQWFVNMEPLVKKVIKLQASNEKINFVPDRFEKIFLNWMNNIQDWCISRQLWWGHQIPAWYKGEQIYVGLEAPNEDGWIRDEDVLDTWFSSALWPFSTLGWPEKTSDLERYFPNDTIINGYDIIFFWDARMVFQSLYLTGQKPFKNVLIHGIIRDELGRKVSKSLGNGVDMMDAVKQFGVDALRYFITTSSAPGQDFRYSEEKIEASWNFINKIWNISRYIGMNLDQHHYHNEEINVKALNTVDKWILNRLNEVIGSVDHHYENFDFGEVARIIYKFVWDDFASWYLEMTKVIFSGDDNKAKINTCAVLQYVLTSVLKLLHPFMPFVTEDIYLMYNDDSITISKWPEVKSIFNFKDAKQIEMIYDIISSVRNTRATRNVSYIKAIDISLQLKENKYVDFINKHLHYLHKFINYNNLIVTTDEIDVKGADISVLNNVTIIIPLKTMVNMEEEKQKLEIEKSKMLQEISRCETMLANQNFINKAPKAKIDEEKHKLKSYQLRLNEIIKSLNDL